MDKRELLKKIDGLAKEKLKLQKVISVNYLREMSDSGDIQKTILVLDGDESVRKSLKKMLSDEDYIVITASNSLQFSKYLVDHKIDLILLDTELPWMDGFELVTALKDFRELRYIPIIFISCKCSTKTVTKAFDIGAYDYITKPYNIEKVKKSVKSILKINSVV